MNQSGPPAPGFFGKLPARGDFLVRRAPAGFQDRWETWLAGFVVAARAALGEAWPDGWLTAPLWHFSLGRDLVPPGGAAGVLVASVDRVGRFFPFSVIGVCPPFGTLPEAGGAQAGQAETWARAAEALALGALDDDFDPDALDAALRDLGPPPAPAGPGRTGAARPTGHWKLPLHDDWPAAADRLADNAYHPAGSEQSVWWCRGSERMQPVHLRCRGLPDPVLSGAMVAGGFEPGV